jgi:CxC2 like cysteine cluster associated with KDZ transposases
MRETHMESPLHQIQAWTGSFFRSAELWEVGVYILLRHSTGPPLCQWLQFQQEMLERFQREKDASELPEQHTYEGLDNDMSGHRTPTDDPPSPELQRDDHSFEADLEVEADLTRQLNGLYQRRHGTDEYHGQAEDVLEEDDDEGLDDEDDERPDHAGLDYLPTTLEPGITNSALAREADEAETGAAGEAASGSNLNVGPSFSAEAAAVPRTDAFSNHYVRVVHINGIHHLALVYCACGGREATHCNLMAERLMPTSFTRYRTLFTHAVLDDFRLANLECKASAYQYFQKLRRHSSPMFLESVPNLYTELRRMSRIWRWLKKLKWAGFGHKDGETTEANPGELANFCPACPQPGINVAEAWTDDPQRYLTFRRL